ncbi:MAG: AMP-binding protein [Deltaproteobacteria bacterium]|nr:AMP-binding protein [Deltaproteobacteria bacterium]
MLEADTLWALVVKRAAESPDRLMAVDERGRRLTFAEYAGEAEAAAAGFAARGIRDGDVVTWQLPTWLESLVLAGALARLGVVQNPILPIYREREVGFCVRQARSRLLIVPSHFRGVAFAEMAHTIAAESPGLEILIADRELPRGDPASLPDPPEDADAVRWLFYTSGTTADPKGARHSDRTLHAFARGMSKRLQITSADRVALVFPFTHVGGIGWMLASLMTGCANICAEAFVPDEVIPVLAREGVTLAGAGTAFHQAYLAAQHKSEEPLLPALRGFPGGGAPRPPRLHYELIEAFGCGVLSGYGLTETPVLTMASPEDSDADLAHSEGRPVPGVELKLVAMDGSPCGPGEEGEVRARAPQLMQGYVDASLDEAAFDAEGYFRTGDLGRLNERGMLTITGRLKDVIIRKGENVSAKEVEDHLYAHPKVADVAVIGLPDPARGERVCAVVQTREGSSPIAFDEMTAFLEERGLMRQKLPEQLELVDLLPRNPAGKVLKHELRARFDTPQRGAGHSS